MTDSKIKYSCAKGCTTFNSKTAFLKGGKSPAEYLPGGYCHDCYGVIAEITSPQSPNPSPVSSPVTPIKNQFTVLGTLPRPRLPAPQNTQNTLVSSQTTPKSPFFDKYSTIVKGSSSSQNVITTSVSSPIQKFQYIDHPIVTKVKTLENFELDIFIQSNRNFSKLLDFLYPTGYHFSPNAPFKNREFYQNILLETESVVLTHQHNALNPNKVDFTKLMIQKVLKPEDWHDRLFSPRKLKTSQNFTYYDYQDAWENVLLLRNYSHSWFIYFNPYKSFDPCPKWFLKWFEKYGLITDAFPPTLHPSFKIFKEHFSQSPFNPYSDTTSLIDFIDYIHAPWIMSWNYQVVDDSLVRTVKIKWWNKFDMNQVTPQAISTRLKTSISPTKVQSPNTQCPTSTSDDAKRKELQTKIDQASSKEEIKNLINQFFSPSSTGSSSEGTNLSGHIQDSLFQDAQDPYSDVEL